MKEMRHKQRVDSYIQICMSKHLLKCYIKLYKFSKDHEKKTKTSKQGSPMCLIT